MWRVLMMILAILTGAVLVYLTVRVHRFSFIGKIRERSRLLSWLLSFLLAALPGVFSFINVMTMEIVLLHTALAFLVCDLSGAVFQRLRKKKLNRDISGVIALILLVLYLGTGWFLMHHVFARHYALETEKDLSGTLRIAEITDAHIGVTLSGTEFSKEMARVQAEKPDLVVIVGDFVDDDTNIDDMKASCEALGELKTRYGVYYVYGNHDNGYYRYRNFSAQDLRQALLNNGVTILEDECVLIADRFYLIGRRDRSFRGRQDIRRLMENLDPEKYIVVLDHQPGDYEEEAASGADLVLSGHTHGGHIFPAGLIGRMLKQNDRVYGKEVRDGTTFIVSSGISGWAIPIKTGTWSEYVVIDISASREMP